MEMVKNLAITILILKSADFTPPPPLCDFVRQFRLVFLEPG